MSFHFTADSMDDVHECIVQELLENPDYESAPRGQPIKELIGASFTLMNPRARLIASPTRAVNYGFAVGELCWYARGEEDLATMAYYNKRMPAFSDDGKTLNSAYGCRMFGTSLFSQWENVMTELLKDPDSRRAMMIINQPFDLGKAVTAGSKDVPCTLALQLLIRDRRLCMSVTMRSNDVWWGMPYDVFSFTCLQEAFLYQLQGAGVPVDELGPYHHHAGSLHLYDRHFKEAASVVGEIPQRIRANPMEPFTESGFAEIVDEVEPFLRNAGYVPVTGYLNNAAETWMVEQLKNHAEKRKKEQEQK